jgi:hypothetical protein
MKTMYEFIHFQQALPEAPTPSKPRKTEVWYCCNNKSGAALGRISWHSPWRQYCFFPGLAFSSLFSKGCLSDIADFIKNLMEERKREIEISIEKDMEYVRRGAVEKAIEEGANTGAA